MLIFPKRLHLPSVSPSIVYRQHGKYFSRFYATNLGATAKGTAEYLARHNTKGEGLRVSPVGFGSFRVTSEQPIHKAALFHALKKGVNLIDTSGHFGEGRSEKMIGECLQESFQAKDIQREDVVVMTKAGYIPSLADINLPTSQYSRVTKVAGHSIHPDFLKQQITQSLERLGLEKIDIFMLNNPERILQSQDKIISKSTLYQQIAVAFECLDDEVKQGRIGGYGICSNSMGLPGSVEYLSLTELFEKCGSKFSDNFLAIQTPFNLFEKEALFPVDRSTISLAEEAQKHNLFVIGNRPLMAIANGEIRQLANPSSDVNLSVEELMSQLSDLFQQMDSLEDSLSDDFTFVEEAYVNKFMWCQVLSENLTRLSRNSFATKHYLLNQVLPALQNDLDQLLSTYTSGIDEQDIRSRALHNWAGQYKQVANSAVNQLIHFASLDTQRKNDDLNSVLSAICPKLPKESDSVPTHSPLSVKALGITAAHPLIGSVLVGMRRPEYVDDALTALKYSEKLDEEDLKDVFQCPLLM
ncbi:Aldo/keto reductase [Basidiobolus meristosporus CBS 931.73]|uniref:Aldo/keto reductase n=1 Tax=Basidiobolus meristosporus CBS 931.73 TaxID=1314790 RepID=A0A1Y1Z6L6_9FUNG|nr:Aldo/keto reductase [Basidiobolus meristosporus CBS 931.73]|eukprot:ORY05764.1 Aldo/keto reductase [Basidiobolus meristosporus CBS 931.73]